MPKTIAVVIKSKTKTSKKSKSKFKGKSVDVESRISRVSKPQTEPTAKISKEDAAEEFVKQVLKASDTVKANIQKSGKGRCIVVDIEHTNADKLTALVYGGSGIIVIAERDAGTNMFDISKHTYDSIENAAKFVRLGFIKGKMEQAMSVPQKQSSGRFGKKAEASSLD